ncbi:hypothetical protein [Bacillus sp. JJ1562]|uniref:hypothetical protein n=1 Tax=Bacillus sp. JJ1562 TaxID=3122960 RepID=UPI0030031FEB
MSLFQICYGPEIGAILNTVQKYPGIQKNNLIKNYQYQPEGNTSSLVESVLNFLINLNFIDVDKEKSIWPLVNDAKVTELTLVKRLNEIADNNPDPTDPNYVFSTMYFHLFVKPNRMYIKDLYYETNLVFDKLAISQEKVNAWKRIMEHIGLGYRVYGGFYALPHPKLFKSIVEEVEEWDGSLQLFFEEMIHPIIPCISNGTVFKGVLYCVLELGQKGVLELSKKQDLPYLSYGDNGLNWVTMGGKQ